MFGTMQESRRVPWLNSTRGSCEHYGRRDPAPQKRLGDRGSIHLALRGLWDHKASGPPSVVVVTIRWSPARP
jgi:hypothetical protein